MTNIGEVAWNGSTATHPAAVLTYSKVSVNYFYVAKCTLCKYDYTICLCQHLWRLSWGTLGGKVLIIWLDLLVCPLLTLLFSI